MTALEAALTILWQGMLGIFAVMAPALYTGRCAQQVERFLSECASLLADAQSADGAISL